MSEVIIGGQERKWQRRSLSKAIASSGDIMTMLVSSQCLYHQIAPVFLVRCASSGSSSMRGLVRAPEQERQSMYSTVCAIFGNQLLHVRGVRVKQVTIYECSVFTRKK